MRKIFALAFQIIKELILGLAFPDILTDNERTVVLVIDQSYELD